MTIWLTSAGWLVRRWGWASISLKGSPSSLTSSLRSPAAFEEPLCCQSFFLKLLSAATRQLFNRLGSLSQDVEIIKLLQYPPKVLIFCIFTEMYYSNHEKTKVKLSPFRKVKWVINIKSLHRTTENVFSKERKKTFIIRRERGIHNLKKLIQQGMIHLMSHSHKNKTEVLSALHEVWKKKERNQLKVNEKCKWMKLVARSVKSM